VSDRVTRKSVLINLLTLPLAAAAIAGVTAPAEAKTSPAAVNYVAKSTNGKYCKNCRFYLASKSAGKPGSCSLVSGPIEPKGYCVAYATK